MTHVLKKELQSSSCVFGEPLKISCLQTFLITGLPVCLQVLLIAWLVVPRYHTSKIRQSWMHTIWSEMQLVAWLPNSTRLFNSA